MDRDNRWDRVALAYACLTGAPSGLVGPNAEAIRIRETPSALEAVREYYDHPSEPSRRGDEFVLPTRIVPARGEAIGIGSGDAVVFFNFRGDRPREITKAFVLPDEAWAAVEKGGFDRGKRLTDLYFCTFADYEEGLPVTVAFPRPPKMKQILGAVMEGRGLPQFRCAETEKFPHVTYFFNDYREQPFAGERRLLVPSPRDVTTYDQKPEMSAAGVCQGVLERLRASDCEPLIIVNFANPDMVGHTGSLPAAIAAVETVDRCTGKLVRAAMARGGAVIVTADHGNAEQMWDPVNDVPHTAHTTNEVPLLVIGEPFRGRSLREGGRLADIAPTLLEMMELEQPAEMTGRSLLA
jgi:2,3-bisphosphoglycerate-independent phosphoglycerate mutase